MGKLNWQPLLDMDLDNGTHTCYFTETQKRILYITQMQNDEWDIEYKWKNDITYSTIMTCKTLTSAKRWVTIHLINEKE